MNPFWLKVLSYLPKALQFGKKKLEKTYVGYTTIRSLGLQEHSADFDSLYNQALFDYERNSSKLSLLVELFKEVSAREAFRKDINQNTEDKLITDLIEKLNNHDKYKEIKDANIDLPKEVDEFGVIFSRKISESRLPKDIEISNTLGEIKAMLGTQIVPKESMDLSEHISEIGKLRESNKHEAVLELLRKFKESKWKSLSNELKYKLELNLGVTYFELGQKATGAKYFIDLLQYNLKPEESFALGALGYSLLDDPENAILLANKALALNDKNSNAYLALLFSKEETIDINEIYEMIPEDMREKPAIAINIGNIIEKKGEYDKAFDIFNKLELDYDKTDSFKCDILVQQAINRIHSLGINDDYVLGQLSDEHRNKLHFAEGKLTSAWEYLRNTDLNKSRWYVIANRGVVYKVLGEKKKAIDDLLESLKLKETFFAYRHLLEVYANDPKETDDIINKVQLLSLSESDRQDVLAFRAIKAHRDGSIKEILPELIAELPNISGSENLNKFYTLVTDFCIALDRNADALTYARELVERSGDDPNSFILLARVYLINGDNVNGKLNLITACALVNSSSLKSTINLLADLLIEADELDKAVEVLKKGCDVTVLSDLTRKLISVYYKLGLHKEVHSIAFNLISKYPDDGFLVDALSGIWEAAGDFDKAIDILNKYLEIKPDDTFMLVKLAMNYYKKTDYANGIKVLDKINSYEKIPMQYQFLIADAYAKGGNPLKGLEIGYEARLKFYSNRTAHNNLIQLQGEIQQFEQKDYYPEVIGIDCYVVLKDSNGKMLPYVIVKDPKYNNEISVDEDLGRNLIGKKLGEEIRLGGIKYKVESILWKYTHAVHDSMNQIVTRFNNEGPMRVLTMEPGENILDKIGGVIEQKNIRRTDKQIEEFYKAGKSTIGINARITGNSSIKYWGHLVSTLGMGVFSIGPRSEIQTGLALLESGKDIIFDVISLLTVFHLDIFTHVEKLPNRKYVAQSTIDVIKNEIQEIDVRKDSDHLEVNKIGEQFYRQVVSVEEKKAAIGNLNQLLEKTIALCSTITADPPTDVNIKNDNDELFGREFNETAVIASEKDMLLVSDDVFFRQLSTNELKINGLPVIPMITYLNMKQVITTAEMSDCFEKLIRLQYRYVPTNERTLLKFCLEGNYSLNGPFSIACDILSNHFIDDIVAVKFVGNFFYELFKETIISPSRDLAVQFVLSKLYEGRNKVNVRKLLVPYVDTKFRLLQVQKDELISIIMSS